MEFKGRLGRAEVYDDYGHHPTEIGATLEGVKTTCKGRVVCVFQPHTYSRTDALKDQFPDAFICADKVILTDIYAARETNESGISSAKIAEIVGEKAIYSGDLDSTAEAIKATVKDGDTVIVMGAGDIFKIFSKLGLK